MPPSLCLLLAQHLEGMEAPPAEVGNERFQDGGSQGSGKTVGRGRAMQSRRIELRSRTAISYSGGLRLMYSTMKNLTHLFAVGHNAEYRPMELHPSHLTLHIDIVSFLGSFKVVSQKSVFDIFLVNPIYAGPT